MDQIYSFVMFFKLSLLLSFFLSHQTFAYTPKEGNITAMAGPYLFKTDYDGRVTNTPVFTAPALIVAGDISSKGALEIGVFHMNKRFIRSDKGQFLAEQTQIIHITMGYRWWLSRYLSTSLTFYSAYPMGDIKILYSDFPKDTTFRTSARDKTEYGFDFATQWEMWHQGRYAVVLDARYSLSVTNRTHEHANHYGAIVGLRYFIQGKDKSDTNLDESAK